jgi:TRAP-type C4-dicarboxylate transport system permease small subunit
MAVGVLRTARRIVGACSLALAVVAMAVIGGMMVTITYDVVMRFAFAAPTDWAYPLNAFGVLSSTMLAAPYLYVRRQHIAMDLAHRAMPRWARRVADAVTAVATGLLGVVLAATAFRSLGVSAERGLTGSGTFNIPNWVPDTALLVTGVLIVLVAILFPPTAPDAEDGEQPAAAVPGGVATDDGADRVRKGGQA